MASATELRRLAEQADADAEALETEAAKAREQARQFRAMAEAAESKALTMVDTERTIRTMDVNTSSTDPRVKAGAGRATRKHAAQKKLYQRGKTITSIAAELKEGRPRVSAWFAEGEANRPIPKRHAETLRDKYGIPLSAWTRIAD